MNEEILEYAKYLMNFGEIKKPKMPNFNTHAYTENEYLSAVWDIMEVFDQIDDEYLTIKHLKGD